MRDKVTLKDLRRLVARGARVWREGRGGADRCSLRVDVRYTALRGQIPYHTFVEAPGWVWDLNPGKPIGTQELDRLIGILGADYSGPGTGKQQPRPEPAGVQDKNPSGEERPKGTDEVAEATVKADGALHGGDGNSGECDAPAATASASQRSAGAPEDTTGQDGSDTEPPASLGACTAGPGGNGGSTAEASADAQADRRPGQLTQAEPTRPGELGEGEVEDKPSTESQRRDAAGGDIEEGVPPPGKYDVAKLSAGVAVEETAPATSEGVPVTSEFVSKPADDIPASAVEDKLPEQKLPPLKPKGTHGGNFSDFDKAQYLALSKSRAAREIKRALEKLIKAVDIGGQEVSPRLSGSKFVRELLSRRCSLARAKRAELAPPLIVLACDCSGSCSVVCTELLAACLAIEDEMPDTVAVLGHSNGHLLDGGKAQRLIDWVGEQTRPIGMVIAFGDWDAGDDYRQICESNAKLVWLDSYCCSVGTVKEASSKLRESAEDWRHQPVAWYQGVGDAKTAAIALRAAAKKGRRS